MGLEGVREAARRDRRAQFTALLHHITPTRLEESFHTLRRDAAAGVDGVTWTSDEEGLANRLEDLHRRIHTGAYRATPSRRVYIPKADGRWRPLGIAALEDKIVILVRYADDSVYGCQNEVEARSFLADLCERLHRFGLELHPEKTRLIEFGRYATSNRKRQGLGKPQTFDFLGFTHLCGKTRKGRFAIVRRTVKKRMRATLSAIRARLREQRYAPIPEQGKWLGRVLRGYFNYHAVPGNLKRLDGFRAEVTRAWRQSLMRRSQTHRMPWSRCNRLVRKYLPSVQLAHP